MNKKYLKSSILVASLFISSISFSMHTIFFRGAKLIGKGMLPAVGGLISYCQIKELNKLSQSIEASNGNPELIVDAINYAHPLIRAYMRASDEPVPVEVEDLFRKKIEKLPGQLSQNLPMVLSPFLYGSPAAALGNVLLVGLDESKKLHNALLHKADPNNDKIIKESTMLTLHEMGHIAKNDLKNGAYVVGTLPIAVEAVSSGTVYIWNKMYGRVQMPKTFLKTALRSSMAVGSIIPKCAFNVLGLVSYKRHREACADRFACQHAESREELEAFRDFFKKEQDEFEKDYCFEEGTSAWLKKNTLRLKYAKIDLIHRYLGDRADMVQGHINKWDEEHKEIIS